MGGDHKCPVCQATFTRPQHVARHMRSREFSLITFIYLFLVLADGRGRWALGGGRWKGLDVGGLSSSVWYLLVRGGALVAPTPAPVGFGQANQAQGTLLLHHQIFVWWCHGASVRLSPLSGSYGVSVGKTVDVFWFRWAGGSFGP